MLRAGIKKFNFLLELLEKSRKALMSPHLARIAKDLAKKGVQISCAKLGTTTILPGKCLLTFMKRMSKELCPKD
jgi:hypothetical protein